MEPLVTPLIILMGIIFTALSGMVFTIIWYGVKILMPAFSFFGLSFTKSFVSSLVTLYLISYFYGTEMIHGLLKITAYLTMKIIGLV